MIVTVASYAAYVVVPDMVDYGASKAAALTFHEGLTAELLTKYNAPKVRTVLITQGYTKTALFDGYHNDSPFLVPTLHPDTVSEGIAKQVLKGESGHVMLPGFGVVLTSLRAMPYWHSNRLRAAGVEIMKKWNGRQVIDLEKWKPAGERAASSDEESE